MQIGDNNIYEDRLQALKEGGDDKLQAAMARLPMLADAMAGDGPMAVRPAYRGISWGPGTPSTTRHALAQILAADATIQVSLSSVTRLEHQLLALAVWHGGTLDRQATIDELGADPEALDEAAAGVDTMFLSDGSRGWVALRPGVDEWVMLPGVPVRDGAEIYTSDQLSRWLRHLRVSAGNRKWERVNALESALRDKQVVERAISALDGEARELFYRIAQRGQVELADLGIYYVYGSRPLQRVQESGLVGVHGAESFAWVWLDVLVALNGGALYPDWTVPGVAPVPLSVTPAERVPSVVGRFDQLLQRWSVSPPPALKSGGLGVKPVRAAAKLLGVPSTEVGLLAALAVELGLLGSVVTATRGRGRNATVDEEWRPTDRRAEWDQEPSWRRWAALVQRWLDSAQLEVTGKPIERHEASTPYLQRPLTRLSYLQALEQLDADTGIEEKELAEWLMFLRPALMAPAVVEQLTEEARVLGLVTSDGPVGLTPVARRLLAGVSGLEALAEGAADHFTVQGDHTVIAPPDLDPDVASDLERFARLESEAGARIYRIEADSVIGALDEGWDVDEILGFLARHSTAPVAQNVERTIRDAAERRGRLVVGSATSWVASEDPTFLAQAVAVKAAKLEAVTPTLAVSSLPANKVTEALRRKGLAPQERTEEKPPARARKTRGGPAVQLRERPVRTGDEIARLAASVTDGTPAPARNHYESLRDELEAEFAISRLFEEEE